MIRYAFTTAAVLLLLNPSTGRAQAATPFLFIGGGATVPVGDYGDLANLGWMGTAGIGVGINKVAVGAEGYYGSNSHDPDVVGVVDGDKTNLYGGSGWLAFRLGQPGRAAPYVLGSAGFLVHKFSPATGTGASETEFVWSGGAGVDIPVTSRVSIYVEGRYMARGDTRFFPIFAGLSFTLGGGGGM